MDEEYKAKVDQACRAAEEFTKLYYNSLDKKRHLISKMYMDSATLIWNGNGKEGKDNIQQFWIELPATDHTITTLDCQPIHGCGVSTSFIVKVSGLVKYNQDSKTTKAFNQNFFLTAVGDKWKIVSDCFRTQETIEST